MKFSCSTLSISTVVWRLSQIGTVHGNYIYAVEKSALLRICGKTRPGAEETRLKNILANFDLAKDFYFSYTYDLTNTLQVLVLSASVHRFCMHQGLCVVVIENNDDDDVVVAAAAEDDYDDDDHDATGQHVAAPPSAGGQRAPQ
jgi:hypothetical protein